MALKLNLSGGAGGRQSRTLASGTLSIGRGDRNDWVLADPDRHLSKTHCMLSVENGQYVLTDLSTNGVSINGARTPTTRDSRVVLTDGDEFRIGDYTIVVQEVSGGAAAGGGAGFGEESDPLSVDPLDDPLGRPRDESFAHPVRHTPQSGRAGRDPFDMQDEAKHRTVLPEEDMFAGRKPENEWLGPSQADNADANRHAMIRGRVTAPQPNTANLDFDALIGDMSSFLGPATPAAAPPSHRQAPPPPAARAPTADPFGSFDDLMAPAPPPQAAPPPPPPQAYQAPPPPPPPAAPPPVHYAPPPAPPPVREANPFDADPFGEPPRPGAAAAAPPPLPAAAPAPAHVAAHVAAPAPAAAPASAGGARAGLEAFLQGANVTKAPGDDPEAALRAIGQVFRILVEGLREVLMSRAAIKSEMRIEGTLIRSNNNNPLKFSFNSDEAVVALLGTERPGYMPPQRAAKEAFDDIKSHELAVMAGVQTALRSLLERFNPEALEGRLTQGLLTSMLPAARKARLWDNFRELHKTIAAEAQDDFQKVFGDAFAEAYEATSRKDSS